jgi:hypothetical protein
MESQRRARTLAVLFAVFFVFAMGAEAAQKAAPAQKDESLRKGETRATLDPMLFSDPTVRKAYQAAKEIPWVLDSIYCYCRCAESPAFRHKSLLSCYVDKHASM